MIHRQTQTPDYWAAFRFTPGDAEHLSTVLLESGEPKPVDALALEVIRHRLDAESAALRRNLENRSIYQPKKTFAVGDELTFPAIGFDAGRVVAVRPGRNPEAGAFQVIAVEMSSGRQREFAAGYTLAHRLNDDNTVLAMQEDTVALTPEELHAQHGAKVAAAVEAGLERHPEFLRIGGDWFLRALMAEVNVGHLNLAEAVLDVASGGPLSTSVILHDLGLPPEIAGALQEISLNNAMARDERFDDVSLSGESSWFLRRLEPPEVRALPAPLKPAAFPGAASAALNEDLRALAVALDDELSPAPARAPEAAEPPRAAQIVLTFPHRLAGTLGWGRRLSAILPVIDKPRVPVKFRDRVTGREFVVWLVQEGRYLYGLGDWYRHNDVPAGAYIEVSRGPDDSTFLVDYRRHRPRREWVRVATQRDNRLRLETAQRAVGCDFDEQMSVFCDDPAAFNTLRGAAPRDVAQAVREAFPEVAKLSPQGNVHASTLYAVVNVITRAAPEDVFAALTASGMYQSVGDAYWHLSEART